MRIYSDVTKKFYETVEECEKAEIEQAEKAEVATREKKELADAVEKAESDLSAAYEEYQKALDDANKLIESAKEQAAALVQPAKDKIHQAQEDKWLAVGEFNKKYGVYRKSYTGEDALKELNRTSNWLDDLFNSFWK